MCCTLIFLSQSLNSGVSVESNYTDYIQSQTSSLQTLNNVLKLTNQQLAVALGTDQTGSV